MEKVFKRLRNERGLSLIELMIVMVIAVALATLAALNLFGYFEKADGTTLLSNSKVVQDAVTQATIFNKNYEVPAHMDADLNLAAAQTETYDYNVSVDKRFSFFDVDLSMDVIHEVVVRETGIDDQAYSAAIMTHLLKPIEVDKIRPYVSGNIELRDHYTIVRVVQLDNADLTAFKTALGSNPYRDQLQGKIFTRMTVNDDGKYYNGVNVIDLIN